MKFRRKLYNSSDFDPSNAIAVCVGVEDYGHLPKVKGAIQSAQAVFDALTKSDTAICNSGKSRLLLNPAYGEFHQFLESYSYFLKPTDHLIFYFCGNTDLVNGKAVLCLRDSVRLSRGDINPFTVQGWQAFFQLSGLVSARSAMLLWDAHGTFLSGGNVKTFFKALRTTANEGLPMPSKIPWALSAMYSEYTNGSVGQTITPYASALCNILLSPAMHTVSEQYILFEYVTMWMRKKLQATNNAALHWFYHQSHVGIPICRNPRAKVRIERFLPYYTDMLSSFAKLPSGDYSPHEVLAEVSPAAWTVVNKLSYAPWGLIADGAAKGTKKITKRGRSFLRGNIKIPLTIVNRGDGWQVFGRETADVKYFRKKKIQAMKEQEELQHQTELFPQ